LGVPGSAYLPAFLFVFRHSAILCASEHILHFLRTVPLADHGDLYEYASGQVLSTSGHV